MSHIALWGWEPEATGQLPVPGQGGTWRGIGHSGEVTTYIYNPDKPGLESCFPNVRVKNPGHLSKFRSSSARRGSQRCEIQPQRAVGRPAGVSQRASRPRGLVWSPAGCWPLIGAVQPQRTWHRGLSPLLLRGRRGHHTGLRFVLLAVTSVETSSTIPVHGALFSIFTVLGNRHPICLSTFHPCRNCPATTMPTGPAPGSC